MKKYTLLHEDIRRYKGILSNARSSVDFSLGSGIYMQLKVAIKKGFSDKLKVGNQTTAGVVLPKKSTNQVDLTKSTDLNLTLREQRLSSEHQDELQSLVLYGSLTAVGIVYFLKIR